MSVSVDNPAATFYGRAVTTPTSGRKMIADNIRALLQELEHYKSRYTTAVGIIERMKYQVGQAHASLAEAQEAEAQLRQSYQTLSQSHQEAQGRIERLECEANETARDYPSPAVPEIIQSQD